MLDVNVGLPEIDERAMMERVVKAVSASVNLPLQWIRPIRRRLKERSEFTTGALS